MKLASVLKFETWKQLKVSTYFMGTWAALILLFLSFFEGIRDSAAQIEQLYASFPKELLQVFGKGTESLVSINGFLANQIMAYLVISGCIFAIFQATNSLAGEIGSGNILFLLSKPVSRLQIFIAKFAAVALSALVTNVVLILITAVGIAVLAGEPADFSFLIAMYLAAFIMEMLFAALGVMIGTRWNAGRGNAVATLAVIASYLLNILAQLAVQADALKYISADYYIDFARLAKTGQLRPEALILVALTLVFLATGAWLFRRKNID